ncbi:zinc-ribbon-domain-containing protein [Halteromyces radiatus]|uniref:zinc-ribbon-domain-containing protein n=1 Tax=Halteromyces radiatus TaxID=101107 RepID=UPI00221F7F98|nr:zinc-ribbon-domain-containing protein [Halteromyces radiatus]KAI8089505.1 zinc-ribbon-domain-containing protein [Halteromyces radiatus]
MPGSDIFTNNTPSILSDSSEERRHSMDHSTEQQDEQQWWQGENDSPSDSQPTTTTTTTTTTVLNHMLPSSSQGDETNEPSSSEAENELRRKILDIQRDTSITAKDKARQIQQLMWQGTQSSPINQASSSRSSNTPELISEGESISYQDKEKGIMGCQHYQRKCKLVAYCCGKIYSCRFCHDESPHSDHAIVRTDTKRMFCMLCQTIQPAAQVCAGCQQTMALYYCDKCKLWDDDPSKSIYHCDDCGICRQGQGLGKDFFHCNKCNICMSIAMLDKHRCIERNLESDCPICGEYMFTSTTTVIFMPCGHCIHKRCYTDYIQTSYQCPTCLKSLGDMSDYFARLDRELARQSMPIEYAKYISHVFCNDCELRSPAKYHFFYHKCAHCSSYNTTVLRTENTELKTSPPPSASSSSTTASSPSSSPPSATTLLDPSSINGLDSTNQLSSSTPIDTTVNTDMNTLERDPNLYDE